MEDNKNSVRYVRYDLPEVVVPPLSSAIIRSRRVGPQCYFRPTGFLIPDDVADDLLLTDVRVGRNSQFYGVSAIPASLFAESTPEARMSMDSLGPGSSIVLSITNTGDRPVAFKGQVRGFATSVAVDLSERNPDHLAVMGFGINCIPGGERATINVDAQVDVELRRLYIPPRVLEDFDVESLTSEKYLNQEAEARVPAAQLGRENLMAEGLVKLEPVSVVVAPTFFTVTVVNRSKSLKTFNGAVLATCWNKNEGGQS